MLWRFWGGVAVFHVRESKFSLRKGVTEVSRTGRVRREREDLQVCVRLGKALGRLSTEYNEISCCVVIADRSILESRGGRRGAREQAGEVNPLEGRD